MLSAAIVAETRRLLDAGWKQRAISRSLPISRGSVQAIASGKRADRQSRAESPAAEQYTVVRTRCVECGGLLEVVPCRACRCRDTMRESPGAHLRLCADEHSLALQLDLRGEDARRYEEVRKGRRLGAA